MYQFVEGTAYEAIPAIEGAQRRLVVCVGRKEERVQFAWADDLTVENAKMCLGREIVRPSRPDGVYTISSAVPLDIQTAAPILELLRREAV